MRTPAPLLVAALVILGGCAGAAAPSAPAASAPPASAPAASSGPFSSEATSAPSESPAASTPSRGMLVTVGFRGGHCRIGPCDRTLAIDGDGGVHVVAPDRQELGTIPPALFQDVREQLSLADFEQLGSRPFTGECPVNYDGQELIYTFHGATGDIRLASCEVELDQTHPLFVAIENALASVPQP